MQLSLENIRTPSFSCLLSCYAKCMPDLSFIFLHEINQVLFCRTYELSFVVQEIITQTVALIPSPGPGFSGDDHW